jgi:homoprotocatechuate degradation regulator HpaR
MICRYHDKFVRLRNAWHLALVRTEKHPRLPAYRRSLAGTLLAAREAVMAPIRPTLRDANVTEQQWRVLRVLADVQSIDARRIAEAALLHAPSVTRILKELSERNLIERRIDTQDGRRAIIAITPSGIDLLNDTATHTLKVIDQYAKTFGHERLDALMREIAAFTASITKPSQSE